MITYSGPYSSRVTNTEPENQADIGSTVTLRCIITDKGVPDTLLDLEWYKDNILINHFGTKYHLIDDDKRRLQIKDVDKTDTGNYTCHFVNRADTTGKEESFLLHITCKTKDFMHFC